MRSDSTLFEVTAPIRIPDASETDTLFVWMRTNHYLWMLQGGEFANRTEEIVGTHMLINLAGRKRKWVKGREDHPIPEDVKARDVAFSRLQCFLDLHICLDSPPVNASAPSDPDSL